MKIWIDADACPKAIRDIILRFSERNETECIFVANHTLPLPKRHLIRQYQVAKGFDVADDTIVEQIHRQDLAITQDLALAAQLLELDVKVITPKGERLVSETIKSRLAMRDFMQTLRDSGVQTGGPNALSAQEKQNFINQLEKAYRQV
ncbi:MULTISPECIES: YaiI/YqxD family protein [unclassified Vibrio]|uniref:UPF0178 protein AB0763_04270 n=1 Tax=Vibrio sp. HB236076 TaxID=3232307 RepID=A0AB39HHL7_9VIBR|nr:YaiI/YqxD family protein [Vibrio sp. HB161653]MDP5254869.1 YaiI/YqxD family protein [Vibrio sp. HB161653]